MARIGFGVLLCLVSFHEAVVGWTPTIHEEALEEGLASDTQRTIHEVARENRLHKLDKFDGFAEDLNLQEPGTLQTPLMAAALSGAHESVAFLLSKGPDRTIVDKDGFTPFQGACLRGHAQVAIVLLKDHFDALERHADGFTPFHLACAGAEKSHTELVRLLLGRGKIDPKTKDGNGKTCADLVVRVSTARVVDRMTNAVETRAKYEQKWIQSKAVREAKKAANMEIVKEL